MVLIAAGAEEDATTLGAWEDGTMLPPPMTMELRAIVLLAPTKEPALLT